MVDKLWNYQAETHIDGRRIDTTPLMMTIPSGWIDWGQNLYINNSITWICRLGIHIILCLIIGYKNKMKMRSANIKFRQLSPENHIRTKIKLQTIFVPVIVLYLILLLKRLNENCRKKIKSASLFFLSWVVTLN